MRLDFNKVAKEGVREDTDVLYLYRAQSPRRSEHESQDDESGNERVDIQNNTITIAGGLRLQHEQQKSRRTLPRQRSPRYSHGVADVRSALLAPDG